MEDITQLTDDELMERADLIDEVLENIKHLNNYEAENNLLRLQNEYLRLLALRGVVVSRKKAVTDFKKGKPLFIKAERQKTSKKLAQGLALARWNFDTEQEIRIGEMCELIWHDFRKMADSLGLPKLKNDQALKEYIKPVAPDYAKKPGAPKKES